LIGILAEADIENDNDTLKRPQTITALRIPLIVPQSAVVLAAILCAVYAIRDAVAVFGETLHKAEAVCPMEALFGILLLMARMIFGVLVAWSFAGVLMLLAWAYDVSRSPLLLQGFRSLDSVILLALPLFVLACPSNHLLRRVSARKQSLVRIRLAVRERLSVCHRTRCNQTSTGLGPCP